MYSPKIKRNKNARRSVKLLVEAYAELMNVTPCDKITVTALVRKAGLNRSTFYAHFNNPDEVRTLLEQRLVDEARDVVDSLDVRGLVRNPYPLLAAVSSKIQENQEYLRFMFQNDGVGDYWLENVKEAMIDKLLENLDPELEPRYEELRLNLRFFIGGYIAVCRDCIYGRVDMTLRSIADPLARTISGALSEVIYGNVY